MVKTVEIILYTLLVAIITFLIICHFKESNEIILYRKALIEQGVYNCNRIIRLEMLSEEFIKRGLDPTVCPKATDFLRDKRIQ